MPIQNGTPVQNRKTSEFFNAINEDLGKQVTDILDEANETQRIQFEQANADAKEKSAAYLRTEVAKITQSIGRRIALTEAQTKKSKFDKRSGVADKVFSDTALKLASFSQSDDYESFLISSAKRMSDIFNGGEIVFRLRGCDMKFSEKIAAAVVQQCRFEADDTIKLGGCRAVSESSRLAADDTLDCRLEEQRSWFYENSGLSV